MVLKYIICFPFNARLEGSSSLNINFVSLKFQYLSFELTYFQSGKTAWLATCSGRKPIGRLLTYSAT